MTRHTWQSWRERYKKNSARLDTKISEIVEQKKPAHGAKGQYGYVRAPEEKPRRIRPKKGSTTTNGATTNHGTNGAGPAAGPSSTSAPELQELENFPPVPMPVVPGVLAPVPAAGYPPIGPGMPGLLYAGAAPMAALTPEAARRHATEEEMEDDEGEWQIRVGDPGAPQPAWAKRKQEAEGSDQGGNKRQRTGWVTSSWGWWWFVLLTVELGVGARRPRLHPHRLRHRAALRKQLKAPPRLKRSLRWKRSPRRTST